jgi:negative regulator of sigma-B (phosphoserine phosphatase)
MNLAIDYRTLATRNAADNGDGVCVRQDAEVSVLMVVDGLGHGPLAAAAATAATEYMDKMTLDRGIETIISGLDGALRGTRGAAAMVCRIEGGELAGCGIGNVELRTLGADLPIVLTPGILGRGVNDPRIFRGTLRTGARLIVFSDGISGKFAANDFRTMERKLVVDTLIARYRRDHDDASVLVADLGGSA